MPKKRNETEAVEAVEISVKTKNFLETISNRAMMPIGDIITILCRNAVADQLFFPLDCRACGKENWRDSSALVYEMFEVEDGVCAFCGARGDEF